MGFLIDTNVLSELRKKERANPGVIRWYAGVAGESLYLSALTIGEVRNGIERLRRRDPAASDSLEAWLLKVETPTMTPLSIELDEQTGLDLQARAQAEGLKPQEWVERLIRRHVHPHWPDSVRALAGSWPGFFSAEELRGFLQTDGPRLPTEELCRPVGYTDGEESGQGGA